MAKLTGFTGELSRSQAFTGECRCCGWRMSGIVNADSYEWAATKILGAHNLEQSEVCQKPDIAIRPA